MHIASRAPADTLQKLVFAQDTGSAIEGAVQANDFTRTELEAGELAAKVKQNLKLWVPWPKQARRPRKVQFGSGAGLAQPGLQQAWDLDLTSASVLLHRLRFKFRAVILVRHSRRWPHRIKRLGAVRRRNIASAQPDGVQHRSFRLGSAGKQTSCRGCTDN